MKKRIAQVLMASVGAAALAVGAYGVAAADAGPRLSGQEPQKICFTEFDEHGHVLVICTLTLTSTPEQPEPAPRTKAVLPR